jgi:hypothetical protein
MPFATLKCLFVFLAFIVILGRLCSSDPLSRPVSIGLKIWPASREFRHALILYFTFHRAYVYRSWGMFFSFVVVLVVLFTAAPKIVIIGLLLLMMSSLLIITEGIVDRMQIM